MAGKFRAEILTPEGSIFDEEVEMLSTRTEIGSIGIRARHTPLLGMLAPTELRLYSTLDSEPKKLAQGEGYLQVSKNGVLVLVEEAMDPSELDLSSLQEKLRIAEEEVSAAPEKTEELAKAERDKRRWETFISIAEGKHQTV